MPLRSHGSLSMNRALMAAGLVDRVQVTPFAPARHRVPDHQPVMIGSRGGSGVTRRRAGRRKR